MALITSANAREMSAKAAEARRARRSTELARLALIDKLLEQASQPPAPNTAPPLAPAEPREDPDTYLASRLARVRRQIDQLSTMLDEETDPQRLDRLACALARVSEIERQLAGRPMPGSRRPAPEVDPSQAARSSRPSAVPMGAAPPAPASVPQANQALAPSPAPGLPSPPQAIEL